MEYLMWVLKDGKYFNSPRWSKDTVLKKQHMHIQVGGNEYLFIYLCVCLFVYNENLLWLEYRGWMRGMVGKISVSELGNDPNARPKR